MNYTKRLLLRIFGRYESVIVYTSLNAIPAVKI